MVNVRLPEWFLPPSIGAGWLHPNRTPRPGVARSYAHDGRCLECTGNAPYRLACDIEARRSVAGRSLARRFGLPLSAFLELWTVLEVVSKLADVPALVLCRDALRNGKGIGGFISPRCTIRVGHWGDLVVAVGWEKRRRNV